MLRECIMEVGRTRLSKSFYPHETVSREKLPSFVTYNRMKGGWVYILECSDGSYYTGTTSRLDQRIGQHEYGVYNGYTASRRPVKLRWSQWCPDIRDAIALERQIKGWTRKKKEALMREDFNLLHILAECKNSSHSRDKS